ncbi:MAG TPA: hypothetical protein VNM90_12180, partial [Haliangium sp.]|nr:hypothetical protein [Haliangium sp.]
IYADGSVNAGIAVFTEMVQADTANVTKLNATNITPGFIVAQNSACDPKEQGYFAKDGNGVLLFCQSHAWTPVGAGTDWSRLVFYAVSQATQNLGPHKVCFSLGFADCSGNTTARVYKSGSNWYAVAQGIGICVPASATGYVACLP